MRLTGSLLAPPRGHLTRGRFCGFLVGMIRTATHLHLVMTIRPAGRVDDRHAGSNDLI